MEENNLKTNSPEKYDTKFLIENEDKLDWEEISASKRRFSPAEIKLFGLSIKWSLYLYRHIMNQEEIRAAVKYLSPSKFLILITTQKLSESFMRNFKEKLNWGLVFLHQEFSENFIFEMIDLWKKENIEDLKHRLKSNNNINLNSGKYNNLLLYFKLKD
jgi:hypothetical protein